nr:MAG TPA: hypothetical protein [Caudoviricetes sp.]
MCIISHLKCGTLSKLCLVYIIVEFTNFKPAVVLDCPSHRYLVICSRSNFFFLCYRLRCCIKCIKTKF